MINLHSVELDHPLSFLVVFTLAAVDGVFPLVPAWAAVVALGVIAGAGDTRAYPLLALATIGAFVGDNVSYWLGARYGAGLADRLLRGRRAIRVREWAERTVRAHALALVTVARIVPGGPTPITLAAGLVHCPRRRFRAAAAAAAALWTLFALAVGVLGDTVVGGNLLLAFVVALAIAGVIDFGLGWLVHKRPGH